MDNYVTLAGIALPLITIAGSAVAFVVRIYSDAKERKRNEFFELMKFLDEKGTLAGKLAAVYELRRFPEHSDFIVRFCEGLVPNMEGAASESVVRELKETIQYFRKS